MRIQKIDVPLWKISTKNIRTSLCLFRWHETLLLREVLFKVQSSVANSTHNLQLITHNSSSRSPRALTDVRASLKQIITNQLTISRSKRMEHHADALIILHVVRCGVEKL